MCSLDFDFQIKSNFPCFFIFFLFSLFLRWFRSDSKIRNTFLMIEQHFFCVYLLLLSSLLLLFPFFVHYFFFDPSDTLHIFFFVRRLYRWFQHVTILFMVRSAFLHLCDIFIFQCQAISDSNELLDEQARDSQFVHVYLYIQRILCKVICVFFMFVFLDVCNEYIEYIFVFFPLNWNSICISIEKHFQVLNYSIVIWIHTHRSQCNV